MFNLHLGIRHLRLDDPLPLPFPLHHHPHLPLLPFPEQELAEMRLHASPMPPQIE
jgi:hypothetical protein